MVRISACFMKIKKRKRDFVLGDKISFVFSKYFKNFKKLAVSWKKICYNVYLRWVKPGRMHQIPAGYIQQRKNLFYRKGLESV